MSKQTLQEQLQQVRRNHILDAAIAVIAERGFQRTTIKQIAKEARVADGTIYNYFANKAAIMTAIVERSVVSERRAVDFADAEQIDLATFTRQYIPQRLHEIEAELPTLKVIIAETLNDAELRQKVNDTIYTPMFQVAEAYVQHLVDRGQIPPTDPPMAARLMAAPLFGLLMLRLLGDEHVATHWQAYGEALAEQTASLVSNRN